MNTPTKRKRSAEESVPNKELAGTTQNVKDARADLKRVEAGVKESVEIAVENAGDTKTLLR